MAFNTDTLAKIANGSIVEYLRHHGDYFDEHWVNTIGEKRDLLTATVKYVELNNKITPAELHKEWRSYLESRGWKKGPKPSWDKKEHTWLVSWDKLHKWQKGYYGLLIATVTGLMRLEEVS